MRNAVNQSPPLDSSGSSVNSESTNSDAQQDDKPSGDETDDSDSYDLVTCFCGKPFAGRPMIECSNCLTWIHLTCARIKKSNIPDVSSNLMPSFACFRLIVLRNGNVYLCQVLVCLGFAFECVVD